MLIDSHSHVNFNTFKDDHDEVIKRALDKNIWLINVGSQYSTSERAVKIAENYPTGVFAAIGLHPIHLEKGMVNEEETQFKTVKEDFILENYRLLARQPKVVAIGETGLDYYRLNITNQSEKEIKDKQKKVFREHLILANELNLPLILHCRGSKDNPKDAYEEMLEILAEQKDLRGVIHCFGSSLEIAQRFFDLGFYIGFTGIITFEKANKLQEVVKNLPLEKILIETDCPYLAPEPYRGKRNEPMYVEFVARKIADIKKIEFKEVANITVKNTIKLFRLK
jgi:TatD DNase family protein